MGFSKLGKNILKVEVVHISAYGIWINVLDKEYFLPHEYFPWFKEARISQIQKVQLSPPSHLYWPDLDVDLELASLENPRAYPLIYK